MDVQRKEIYSEVYSVLNMLGYNYISKLPSSLYKMIESEKSNLYNPQYVTTVNLEQQNIKRESLAMIALFHLNYWYESIEEKEQLKRLFKDNEEKHQSEIREMYNPDNIFKKRRLQEDVTINNEVAMVEYKEPLFRRFINKIKNIFHIR